VDKGKVVVEHAGDSDISEPLCGGRSQGVDRAVDLVEESKRGLIDVFAALNAPTDGAGVDAVGDDHQPAEVFDVELFFDLFERAAQIGGVVFGLGADERV
jgi:hypothetical protein